MIASVIEENTKGYLFFNDYANPSHAFVINKFGFCQEFYSEFDGFFYYNIILAILETKGRMKLRCYSPQRNLQNYLDNSTLASKACRIQFIFSGKETKDYNSNAVLKHATEQDIGIEDYGLELVSRYYENEKDFLTRANPIVAIYKNNYAGIVYIAGKGNGRGEIDVFIKPEYRGKGLGTELVRYFIADCLEKSIMPSWDCYENNIASIALAKKCDFKINIKYMYYNIEDKSQSNG